MAFVACRKALAIEVSSSVRNWAGIRAARADIMKEIVEAAITAYIADTCVLWEYNSSDVGRNKAP
jgi:hypothetical protein